jgi:hypothetical protein
VREAHVVAVNSCIAELRANGAVIHCTRERKKDRLICRYRMVKAPE